MTESAADDLMINYVKVYGSDVARLFASGERLVDMGGYREPLIGDESRLGRTPEEMGARARRVEERSPGAMQSEKFVQGFDPFAGGLQTNPDRIDRFLGGLSGEGGPGSAAGRLWRAAKGYGGIAYYAVTDRRLLLVGNNPGADTFDLLFEVPLAQVVAATVRGKLLMQRGRVEVRFADGSMKAWTPGMFSTSAARRLVAALSGQTKGTGPR
ncbi:hypothetical protein [Plantactinospora sp. BC1]|uniref:hypothetical protein n=1 Tax=Plantactinospora sp. BC1 TaxID=2108470 RepID=UPI00131EF9C5|nr:hypothetical protein [Plantactinospora sp. BC1]